MRIVSGKYKGKVIKAPKNLPTRPTTDFAKEALFNILENNFDLKNITVLDLFCGTGNISYEFVSRGCENIVSVDKNYNCIRFVNNTLKELNPPVFKALKMDTFKFIDKCYLAFDIIFADPPYDMENIEEIPLRVFNKNLLNSNGWLIVEHSKKTDMSKMEHFLEHRKYGNVNFSIFQKKQ